MRREGGFNSARVHATWLLESDFGRGRARPYSADYLSVTMSVTKTIIGTFRSSASVRKYAAHEIQVSLRIAYINIHLDLNSSL